MDVVSDFLSNKALLLPDLYKKFEDLVDKTALIKSLKEPKGPCHFGLQNS
jgi:hypothetical protein